MVYGYAGNTYCKHFSIPIHDQVIFFIAFTSEFVKVEDMFFLWRGALFEPFLEPCLPLQS
jgi:hypothetical protein